MIPRIPTTEILWEQVATKEGAPALYFVTSDRRREVYKLWRKEKNGFELLRKASSPVKLRELIKA
jgi:hypothetical protein